MSVRFAVIRIVSRFLLLGLCAGCAGRAAAPQEVHPDANVAAPSPTSGFAGLWKTTYGSMRLAVEGTAVHGSYSYGEGATLEGRLVGTTAQLTYREADGTVGRALFSLTADGKGFDGVWQSGASGDSLTLGEGRDRFETWSGERIESVPGRVWLVILEANWEEGLSEHEYSYGAMLRAFFERLPNVAVRHRFIHDRDDLLRYCRETATLPDPVVLYISSHGSPKGLETGEQMVDGATLGTALRDAGNLVLLHLGACSVLREGFGAALMSASSPHAGFPISGYRRDADWAGSAIIDFTYLDLILEHGMTPEEAAAETKRTVQFAGKSDGSHDAIEPMDFTILPAARAR